jgi:hypothetical protein
MTGIRTCDGGHGIFAVAGTIMSPGSDTKCVKTTHTGGDAIMRRKRAGLSRSAVGSAGFTVAEFVAAAGILFVVLTGVLGAVEYAGASTRVTAVRQDAVAIATQQVEKARNIDFNDLGVYYAGGLMGNPGGTIPAVQTISTTRAQFNVVTTISWNFVTKGSTTSISFKKYKVVVSWTTPTPGGSVSLETNIFGQGVTPANSGVVKVTVADVENPSTKVSACRIRLKVGTFDQVGTSDENGEAMWGAVPLGSVTASAPYTINPDYLIDTTGINGLSVTTGLNDLGIVYAQVPRKVKVHVRTSSLPSVGNVNVTLKDTVRNEQFVVSTDANGDAMFDATTISRAGLWFSSYTVSAVAAGYGVASTSLALSSGGPIVTYLALTLPDPVLFNISMKSSITGLPITGQAMTVSVKDPSNALLSGSGGSFTDTAVFNLTTTGTYKVTITDVSGYLDTVDYSVVVLSLGSSVSSEVPMVPLFQVFVKNNTTSGGVTGAKVTMTNASTGVVVNPISGSSPAVTASDGLANYAIPATANFNVVAVVNGVSYTGSPSPVALSVGSPPTSQYVIAVSTGDLTVTVATGSGSTWKRLVGVYDSSNALVASAYANKTDNSPDFLGLYPGMYTVVVGRSTITAMPATLPSASSNYKVYPLTSPGVVAGSTYDFASYGGNPITAPN